MRPFQASNVVGVLRQVTIELFLGTDEVLGGAFYNYSGLTSSTSTYMESDSNVYAESNPSALVHKPMCLHGVTLKCLRGVKLPIFARSQTPVCTRGQAPVYTRSHTPAGTHRKTNNDSGPYTCCDIDTVKTHAEDHATGSPASFTNI